MKFEVGDRVRITNERNTEYIVMGESTDGSATLYGGHKNPNNKQGYRSVQWDDLKPAKRKK